MLIVYYFADAPDPEGCIPIYVTDKPYWDANGVMDEYAESPHNEEIARAMAQCGAEEILSSTFDILPGHTVQSVVDEMRKLGFDLQANDDFAALLA